MNKNNLKIVVKLKLLETLIYCFENNLTSIFPQYVCLPFKKCEHELLYSLQLN